MKRIILLAIMSNAAFAGQQTGQVVSIRVSSMTVSSNTTHIQLSGVSSGRPPCATLEFWAFDSDTPQGKSFLAAVLVAQATGREVTIYGTNNCALRPGMESVAEIDLAP